MKIALSLLAALACAATVCADTVYDNVTTNPIANATVGSSIGQSFVTGGTTLSLNTLLFAQFNEGNAAYSFTTGETVNLYANDPLNNSPVTTLSLATFTLTQNVPLPGLTEADVDAPTILTANTRYWLVLAAPVATGTVYWSFDNPAGYTANTLYGVDLPATNTAFKTLNGVTTFFNFDQGPQSIFLDADAIAGAPEPSTYAMFAVGGLGAFLFVRRARRAQAA